MQYRWILSLIYRAFGLTDPVEKYTELWTELIEGEIKTHSSYEYMLVKSTNIYGMEQYYLKIKSPSNPETEALLEDLYRDIREQLARYDDYLLNAYESMCGQ